jgi:hypothetical protein
LCNSRLSAENRLLADNVLKGIRCLNRLFEAIAGALLPGLYIAGAPDFNEQGPPSGNVIKLRQASTQFHGFGVLICMGNNLLE